jgi:predicted nucleic acid-binding protein
LILYLDTSAFIKLYVNEPGADVIRAAVTGADQVHAHWIAYSEMRSALARLHRMGRQSVEQCKREFENDWELVSAIMPDERMLRRSGDLAERFGLRGYDSVHLAAAESLRVDQGTDFLRFASFDRILNQSAQEIGLSLLA